MRHSKFRPQIRSLVLYYERPRNFNGLYQVSLMPGPVADSDGYDFPWHVDEPVPGKATVTIVDVLFGMHYAEAVTLDDQRRPVADLSRLSLVEPDHAAP